VSTPARVRPAVPPVRGSWSVRRSKRLPVLALLVFLATLPLEWITLSGLWGGFIKPFHVAALFLIAVAIARWRPERLLSPVLFRYGTVYFSYAFLLAIAVFGGMLHADPYLSAAEAARGTFYFVTSAVVAGVIVALFVRPFPRGLAWAGVLALGALMFGLVAALTAQNLNPLTILADALRQADPDIIARQLLRSAFRSGEGLEEAAPNLRHKVFGALLVAVFLGLACRSLVDRRRTVLRGVLLVGGAVGAAAVLLSLSRSIILCLVITLTLLPLRALVRDRVRPLGAAGAALGVLAIGILVISPVGQLIYNRVSATGSYQSRLEAAGPSFIEEFLGAALIGTTKSAVEKAPHNFVLDSWLSGGVLAAVAAAVLLLSVLRLWLREAYRWVQGRPGWVLPVGQVWVLGLGVIPLVRSFTSGTLFHMVEWTAIGLFLGLVIANERLASARQP
jgi:hypothetical protein